MIVSNRTEPATDEIGAARIQAGNRQTFFEV